MERIQIYEPLSSGADGRPVLRMMVCGHEVEASFSTEENTALIQRLKQTLFDAYLQNMEMKSATF